MICDITLQEIQDFTDAPTSQLTTVASLVLNRPIEHLHGPYNLGQALLLGFAGWLHHHLRHCLIGVDQLLLCKMMHDAVVTYGNLFDRGCPPESPLRFGLLDNRIAVWEDDEAFDMQTKSVVDAPDIILTGVVCDLTVLAHLMGTKINADRREQHGVIEAAGEVEAAKSGLDEQELICDDPVDPSD